MGLFGRLFEKKECSICGGEIGLLGNNKLADGNMCDDCAGKLSPWFEDRRESTVEQIEEQLEYREENKKKVAAFNATRSFGDHKKVYLDEDKMQFLVTDSRNYKTDNPDVLDFSQVTGVDVDIDQSREEQQRRTPSGDYVSYNPPRYTYSYDFYVVIHVNHPYFQQMRIQLNNSSIEVEEMGRGRVGGATMNPEYREYQKMGQEIKRALTAARRTGRDAAAAAAAPKQAVTCPWCGATTMPTANGCCEYCGGSVNG